MDSASYRPGGEFCVIVKIESMKEFQWVEKATDKVIPTIVLWIVLAAIANGLIQLGFGESILGEAIIATLQLIGLFFFLKSVVKWVKRQRAESKTSLAERPQEEVIGRFVYRDEIKQKRKRMFVIGFLTALVIIAGFLIFKHLKEQRKEATYNKYQSCMENCEGYLKTRTQRDICYRECISKYK